MISLQKPLFITVEGGEGVGKSLFIKKLSEALSLKGLSHKLTREPGGTGIAEKLRGIFAEAARSKETLTIEAEFLIIAAARAQHIKNFILPSLAEKATVLCDRFVDSSFVYQGSVGGLHKNFIATVTKKCTGGLQADLTFLLDCPIEIAQKRMNQREGETTEKANISHYDQKDFSFHKKVREAFLDLAKENPERIVILDSTASVDDLVKQAISIIEKKR